MRCIICDSTDKWKNVDKYRAEPKGMELCMSCGFVSYPSLYKTEEEIKEFYRGNNYRKPPMANNTYTGQRKLHYHGKFLQDVMNGWKKEDKAPVIGEVGAAFGMVLGWFKKNFPKADVYGTELTLSYRRNAKHLYGIDLTEDLDLTKKYDLIASYKVAEHQMDIDKRLIEYKEALADDGLLYISVPTWFNRMHNFGAGGFTLQYYYDTSHINVWTRGLFETLLKKVGLEIIKEDHAMYDNTYLCKRNDELMKETPQYEDPAKIEESLTKIKEASDLADVNKFDEALKIWPDFPKAHMGRYEMNRARYHDDHEGIQRVEREILIPAMNSCVESADVGIFVADLYMRYSQYEKAIDVLSKVLEWRPEAPGALIQISQCFRQLASKAKSTEDKVKYFKESRQVMFHLKEVSLQHEGECLNWIYYDNAQIPVSNEKNC